MVKLTRGARRAATTTKKTAAKYCQCGAPLVSRRSASHWTGFASSSPLAAAPTASPSSTASSSSLFFYPSFFGAKPHASTSASVQPAPRPQLRPRFRSSRFSILNSSRPRSISSSFSNNAHQSYAVASSSSSASTSHTAAHPSPNTYGRFTSSVAAQDQQTPAYEPPPFVSRPITHTPLPAKNLDKGKARAVEPAQLAEHTLKQEQLETEEAGSQVGNAANYVKNSAMPPSTPLGRRRALKTLHSIRTEQQEYARIGKLNWARGRWYKFLDKFYPLSFDPTDNYAARKAFNLTITQLVALHVPLSDSRNIQALITRYEELADTTSMSISPYNSLLKTYAQQLDVPAAFETFHRMKDLSARIPSLQPNERSFNHLITMFAHLREPESAQRLFDEMGRNGIEPTQASYTSLMNAHVEAGHWDHAIVMFDFLDSHPEDHPLKPDISTCTTLLKTYVLMGAPVSEVLKIYAGIIDRNLRPTSRTFALLLQSACDAGMTDFAEEIFAKMDSRAVDPAHEKKDVGALGSMANVYTFTVMIRGLLRAGKQDEAKQYYDEMVSRGIEPSSATWSTLIGAYAQAQVRDENAEMIVQNLLDEYMKVYSEEVDGTYSQAKIKQYEKDKPLVRGTALHSLYGPVITAYGQMAALSAPSPALLDSPGGGDDYDAELTVVSSSNDARQAAVKALDKYQEMLSLPGAKPSIHIYTALLDAYRRANDMRGLQHIWDALYEFALTSTRVDYVDSLLSGKSDSDAVSRTPRVNPSRRNILCFPLSIYIDALSSNHLHGQIADLWMQVQQQGFGFDAGNWNHLAVALVRAGELDRAFWTVETVLLQEDQELDSVPGLEVVPSTLVPEPDSADLVPGNQINQVITAKAETPIRPPNRSHEHHVGEKEHLLRYGGVMRLPEKKDPARVRAPRSSARDAKEDYDEVSEARAGEEEVNSQTVTEETPALNEQEKEIKAIRIPLRSDTSDTQKPTGMTSSYSSLRKKRRGEIWTAYASTLRVLEDALLRLQQSMHTPIAAEDDEARASQITARRRQAAKQFDDLQEKYPATREAIGRYRRKMNRLATRTLGQ